MKLNKYSLLLIITLTVIVFIVEALTISILYNTAFEQQRAQLIAITQTQVKLIEAVARFDSQFSKNDVEGDSAESTLGQIRDAHLNTKGFGKTGEFVLGKKENNKIVFLLPRRFKDAYEKNSENRLIDVGGTLAEPIQLALAGKSGTIIAHDYRGELVLAAYEYIAILNYGVVTKIDLQEIRAPFIRVGLISVVVALMLIVIGAFLFLYFTRPVIKSLEGSKAYNRMLFESSPIGLALCRMDGSLVDINPAYTKILGRGIEETKQLNYWEITPEDYVVDEQRQLESLKASGRYGPYEKEYWHKDGHRVPVRLSGQILERDGEKYIWSSVEDISDRKNTEKKLALSASRLNAAQQLAKVGSWELDLLSGDLVWSDEIFNMFEIDKTKFNATYDAFLNAIHPDDRDSVNDAYSQSLTDRKAYEITHRLKMSDGTIKHVRENCKSYFNNEGEPIRSVGTVQDISEQWKLESEIEKSRAHIEAVFESMSDAIIVTDTERKITLTNKAAEKLFGYQDEELLGNKTSKLYAFPEDFSETGKQRYNVDARGDLLPYEVEYQKKDGEVFLGETLGAKIISEEGEVYGFVGIIRDITERKKSQQDLYQIKTTLDQTLDCVFMFDAETLNFIYVNQGALQQVGYSYDELMTMHPYDIKPEVSKEGFDNIIAPLVSGDTVSINFETLHQNKNGTKIPVEIFLQFLPADEATVAHFVAIVRDITERRKIEEELKIHRENLEILVEERTNELHLLQDDLVRKERLATLGQLTATVSHELRNPLGAMRPSLYVIQKMSDENDERVQKAIERIDRNISRCDNIIDELLDHTRIVELNLQSTEIDNWLGSVLDEQVIPEGILMETRFNLTDVELNIDRDRLRRAVINVFDNACHSMMDDNLELVNGIKTNLIIETQSNNKRIEIIITDTGSGISDDVLNKIFEPLFSTKGFGVGLGMPTVKQIMEQHHGGIEVVSDEGKGTVVILWLPVEKNK